MGGPAAETVALRFLGKRGEERNITYAELARETDRFANVLRALDVEPGERVFVLAGRIPELYITGSAEVAPDIDPATIPATIDPGLDLAELEIDSIDFLNLVIAVHEKTGIDIPERDYPKLSTVNDAVAYLMEAQQPGPSAEG